MCIGSDRSTGDSFGPLVGHKLSRLLHNNVFVYGTLDNPVHAKNLSMTIDKIYTSHSNPLIIAIDACLGSADHIGYIGLKNGPLNPGAGVKKELPSVGDISITGVVNISGFMDFLTLQNTRLSVVMKLADVASIGIKHTLHLISTQNSNSASYLIN